MNELLTWLLDAVQSVDPAVRTILAGVAIMLETSVLVGLVVPGDTVVIVGLNDRFQIWSREKWAARRAEQRALAKAGMAQIGALKLAAQMKLAGGGS